MKNMKRALSLVLAMVMLLGMMAVPTGAAGNFKDETEINYVEAVEVTSGLGLFAGADGNFMPKGTVTRAQMATIIVKMFHGSQANADTFKRLNGSFSDIASFEGGWAEGYINWCSSMGAVAGYGDGTFRPGQAVTTAEAVTMIINALGVDAGPGQWPITVMAKADEMKLFKDLSPKPDTSKALTREELAVISLNAIQYSPEGKVGFVVGDQHFDSYYEAFLAAGRDPGKVSPAAKDTLATEVFELKTMEGYITGNQSTGLDYTEINDTVGFAIQSDLDDIGHYVTVYYAEQYTDEDHPGLAYSIVDESIVVVVEEEPITTYAKYREAFGSRNIAVAEDGYYFDDEYNGTVKQGNMDVAIADGTDSYTVGSTYYVPTGTYIIYDGEIVAYVEPITVHASRVVSILDMGEEVEVMLMGVDDVLYNSEPGDQIQEYTGMQAQDYITYVKAQDQYVLTRAGVVSGKISDVSEDDLGRQVINVNGTKYTAFTGANYANDTGRSNTINVNTFDYSANYDIYVTGDKFIFFDVSSGGLNLDNVVFVLGTLNMEKDDQYGETCVETYARGVDMKGNEVMLLVGKTVKGNTYPSDGIPAVEQGFYTVADHTNRDAKKEGIKKLTGFETRYNSQTKAPFVSEYYLGANDMTFSGSGTFGAGYSFSQTTTAYVVVDGEVNQSTPLETSATTGSISITLDREGNKAKPIGLLTRTDEGVNMIEAVVILSDLTTATGKQTIYISEEGLEYTGRTAAGYSYDVYNATTGAAMTIVTKEDTLPVAEAGFYRVAKNSEDGTWTFYLTGEKQEYKVPSVYGETGGAAGWEDGINAGNVAYGQTFDYIRSGKMYGSASDVITKVRTVTGAKVIDLRDEEQIALDKVPAITSVDQLSALKTTRPDVAVFFDAYVNVDSTNAIKTVFITSVRDAAILEGNNSVLYAPTALPTTGEYTFYVAESGTKANGETITLTLDDITVKTQTGDAVPTCSALYEYEYDGVTNTHKLTALVASHGGGSSSSPLGYFGYTQGLHKYVSDISGNTVTVASADHTSCGLACTSKYAAPLTLLPSSSTAVVDLRENRHGGEEITTWSQFKAELNEGGTVFYVDYYQPAGLGLTSSRPADCVPSLIVITDSDRPLIRANTLLISKDPVKTGSAAKFMVVDGEGYTLGEEISLSAGQVTVTSAHTNSCVDNNACTGFFQVVGGDDTSVTVNHLLPSADANWEYGMHNIVVRWDADNVAVLANAHTRTTSNSANHGCGMTCFNYSAAYREATNQLDLSNTNIPVYDLVTGQKHDVTWLKNQVKDTITSPDAIQSNSGDALLLNYWCAEGQDAWTDGVAAPDAIFVMAKDAETTRPSSETIMWSAREGDVIYMSSTSSKSADTFMSGPKTEKVYGIDGVAGRTGFDGNSVYLQVNYYSKVTKGLFKVAYTDSGLSRMEYIAPTALTQALPTDAVIVAGPTGATTAAEVNAILAGGGSVTAAVAVGANGITYVYVSAAS